MAKNVAVALSTNVAAFRQQMASAGGAVRTFGTEAQAMGTATATAGRRGVESMAQLERQTKSLSGTVGGLRGALGGLTALTAAAGTFKIVGDVQQTQVAFEGLLGSATESDTFIREMQQFAATTPFEMPGLTKASQQLLALGATTDQTLARLKVIGGAISTAGSLSQDSVDRVVRALAQIEGKGRLAAEELNQLNEVIPSVSRVAVYDAIAAKMGITREAAARLANEGLVPAGVGLEAIYGVMLRLPGATDAMARQSETLLGRLSTLRDTARQAVAEGFGPLADAAGDLLAVTIPLVSALGDLLGAITSNAAAVEIMQGLVVAFAAMKVAPVVTSVLAFGQAMTVAATQAVYAASAIGPATVAMNGMRTAAVGLVAKLGPVGIALTGLYLAYQILKPAATAAEEATTDFTGALSKAGDEADKLIGKTIAVKLAEEGLVDSFDQAGISLSTVRSGVEGWAEGTQEGTARTLALNDAIVDAMKSGKISAGTAGELTNVVYDMAQSMVEGKKKVADVAAAEAALGIAGTAAAAGQAELAKAIGDAFNPLQAYQAAVKATTQADQQSSKAATDAIRDRFQTKKDLLDADQRAEKAVLDRQTKARKDALDQQLDDEKKTLDAEHEAFLDAIDARYDAERDALDRQARDEKNALDDRHRAERQALDERLELIDEEADKRKKAAKREWEAEQDRIQFMIDSTFGEEREAWKARLVAGEDAYDERLNTIEDAADDEKTAETNGLDDRQRGEEQSLDDRLGTLNDNLDDRETAEKTAETIRFDNATAAWTARAKQQKEALDLEVTDLETHLTAKYDKLKKNLEDQEKLAATAEETRRTNAAKEQGLSLAQYQKFLDDELKAADKFNMDLAIIASRGGADVMAEIQAMDPAIVAQAAAAGPEAFTRWLDSIRALVAAGKPPSATSATPGPGGWHGGVRLGARGHITRQAMISSTPILWAEAGPEAYIPLGVSKRDRGETILAQTAGIMGFDLIRMANGGITGMAAAGGRGDTVFAPQVTIHNSVAVGVDGDLLARKIRAQVAEEFTVAEGRWRRDSILRGR